MEKYSWSWYTKPHLVLCNTVLWVKTSWFAYQPQNHENFTPPKIPAIRYTASCCMCTLPKSQDSPPRIVLQVHNFACYVSEIR